MVVTVAIREKGVSGIFSQLNLKDLEQSLGTGRLSGTVKGNSKGQATLLVSQQQELIELHSCALPWMPAGCSFCFSLTLLIFLVLFPLTIV